MNANRTGNISRLTALVVSLPLILGGCLGKESKEPEVKFFRDGYTIKVDESRFRYEPQLDCSFLNHKTNKPSYVDDGNNGSVNELYLHIPAKDFMFGDKIVSQDCRDESFKEECEIAQQELTEFKEKYGIEKTHEEWIKWLKTNYEEDFEKLTQAAHRRANLMQANWQ